MKQDIVTHQDHKPAQEPTLQHPTLLKGTLGKYVRGILRGFLFLAGGAAILVFLGLPSYGQTQPFQKKNGPLHKRVSDVEKELVRIAAETDVYTTEHLTDSLKLCDRKIPLSKEDVRERFEREYFGLLENKGTLVVVVKRYLKYYGLINGEIQKAGVPPDLIYLVITESLLNPRSVSPANAVGLWQFMKETGKKEGLLINDNVDERYNIKKATRSAIAHLKRLYGEFGDWPIAMAAYNAGAGRLRQAIENQETSDFFDLHLPQETERYIFRIAAIKEIIAERERFGIYIEDKDLYKPVILAEVSLELENETHVNMLAKCMEVSYRTFMLYNLHFRKYRLPKGTYTVNVPYDKKEIFLRKLRNYPSIRVIKEG
jgi:membrane-bound lytic murein transglycosylase D